MAITQQKKKEFFEKLYKGLLDHYIRNIINYKAILVIIKRVDSESQKVVKISGLFCTKILPVKFALLCVNLCAKRISFLRNCSTMLQRNLKYRRAITFQI